MSRCGQHACDSEQPLYDASWHEKSDLSIKSSVLRSNRLFMLALLVNTIRECDKIHPETLIGFKQEDDLLTSKLLLLSCRCRPCNYKPKDSARRAEVVT